MKKPRDLLVLLVTACWLASTAWAQFSFYQIDDFEGAKTERWYRFGNAQMAIGVNPSFEADDVIGESCGFYSLKLNGGIGSDLGLDATAYTRLQVDLYGSEAGGKLKIELFDDDNNNNILEQDSAADWQATKDDKYGIEVKVLEKGFTRLSIPFSAFKLENPGKGDGVWNPHQKNGSAGLLKMQIILLADRSNGQAEVNLDNILFTY